MRLQCDKVIKAFQFMHTLSSQVIPGCAQLGSGFCSAGVLERLHQPVTAGEIVTLQNRQRGCISRKTQCSVTELGKSCEKRGKTKPKHTNSRNSSHTCVETVPRM